MRKTMPVARLSSRLIVLAAGALTAALASAQTPSVGVTIGGNGQNNGRNDIFLDYVQYSETEIYTDFIRPQGIVSLNMSENTWRSGQLNVIAGKDTTGIGYNRVVPDNRNGRIENGEISRDAFKNEVLKASQSRNLNWFINSAITDTSFELTMDFSQDPLRHRIIFFERGPGGPNSIIQLEAVDAQGRKIGNAVRINPSQGHMIRHDFGGRDRDAAVYATTDGNVGKQELGFYDLHVSDFGVSSVSYLRFTTPGSFGFNGDLQPDFKIMGTNAPVPEPGTMLAIGAGAAFMAWRRKRRA